MKIYPLFLLCFAFLNGYAQDIKPVNPDLPADTILLPVEINVNPDSTLRIINLNPFFTLEVDSILNYDLQINKLSENYFWYLKESPIGVKLDKRTGLLYFKADKAYFKSGKLKYDIPYKVEIGVQNLRDAKERYESSFTILFYSTDVVVSKLKPTVGNYLSLLEGDSIRFRVQCEEGSFPIEKITIITNEPISNFKPVVKCDDEFAWMVPFDFIRDNDTATQKILLLQFIGVDKFQNKDTTAIKFQIRPGINYPMKIAEHKLVTDELKKYITNLKLTFYVISKTIKSTKSMRTGFDVSGSTTAMMGTIISTTATSSGSKNTGAILPSIGLSLVPIKEAVAPGRVQEQNTASQIRATTKRLEYILSENGQLIERDPEILVKAKKMREELKQSQMQLIDLPMVEFDPKYTQQDAEKYFNNPKVNKKYKLKVN
ncbi:MAG: hypothetical protein CK547_04650 [Chitinophagaceae bacterium]|nr:MAG: hypothetical protein CK547_04650 [Chitinophagaceae bacterium]